MITKYFNQYTNEPFNTPEEADASEKKYLKEEEAKKRAEAERKAAAEKKNAERALEAKEVDEAYKAFIEARKAYQKKLSDFCKKYGTYHMSVKDTNTWDFVNSFFDLL